MTTKEQYVISLFVDPFRYTEGVLLGEETVECLP